MPNQSNAFTIRAQMRDIRADLSQHVREVKQESHQLTDWKFYIRRYPSLLLPVVSLLAFAIVPKKRAHAVHLSSGDFSSLTPNRRETAEPSEKRSFLRGIAVAIAGIAMRSATSFAIAKATDAISHVTRNHSGKNTVLPSENRRS